MFSMMSKKSTEMTTDHLRDLVHQMLCDIGQLESSQFPLCERPLTRGGNPCGVLFSVNGPREVKLTAVWDCLKNKLFVYCLLYTSPSPRDGLLSRMPSSA